MGSAPVTQNQRGLELNRFVRQSHENTDSSLSRLLWGQASVVFRGRGKRGSLLIQLIQSREWMENSVKW